MCDTRHTTIELVPEPGRPWRVLVRKDGADISHVDLHDPCAIDFAYVRRLADLVDLAKAPGEPISVLHIGGGGFTLPRYVAATRKGSKQTVAEIDPEVVVLARTKLALGRSADLRVRVLDGLVVLERRGVNSADLVVLDAFEDGTTIPAHLADSRFAEAAARVLRPRGVLAVNVVDEPPNDISRAFARLLHVHFGHLALITPRKVFRGRQGGNLVLLAGARPLPVAKLRAKALRGPSPELLVHGDELAAWSGYQSCPTNTGSGTSSTP